MKKLFLIVFTLCILTAQAQRKPHYSNESSKTTGLCLTLGGVGLTGAAILEGGSQYGTYVNVGPSTSNGYVTSKYVIPPVWKQTPRNILFCVGVGVTITGLITLMANK